VDVWVTVSTVSMPVLRAGWRRSSSSPRSVQKNGYRFGISMEFADRAAYEGYNEHPDHVRFVQERWLAEVSDFLELDYVALEPGKVRKTRVLMFPSEASACASSATFTRFHSRQ
jgi:hypothetical protein